MVHIRLITEVPGPERRKVLARHERFVAGALSLGFPAAVREAESALLTDVDGTRFIDRAGGVGAAERQLRRFVHTDYTVAPYALYGEVAERLAGLVPGGEGGVLQLGIRGGGERDQDGPSVHGA